jgi:hypothetical protein
MSTAATPSPTPNDGKENNGCAVIMQFIVLLAAVASVIIGFKAMMH